MLDGPIALSAPSPAPRGRPKSARCGVRRAALAAASGTIEAMTLSRIAWLTTVGICLFGAVLLFIAGYQGYGLLSIVVGAAAALNLR